MDNISEARTEVESIVAAPPNTFVQTTTSVSQDPIDGGARERLKSYDESESGELNVSIFGICPKKKKKEQFRLIMYFLKGYNERKVGFSVEEEDESEKNDSEHDEDMEKKHPLKLHRR